MEALIYKIENQVNGKCYVGSTTSPRKRYRAHKRLLRLGKHHSVALQAAWSKYGEAAFLFEPIEIVANKVELLLREQHYLDALQPAYNMAKDALAPRRGRKLSPEQRIAWAINVRSYAHKISATLSGRPGLKQSDASKKKISSALIGHSVTPEQIEKQKAKMKDYKHSSEVKLAIGAASSARVRTEETKAKSAASVKASWEKRRLPK